MSDSDESQNPMADPQEPWTPEVRRLLVEWRDRANVASKTHFAVANRLSSLNMALGIPVVVLTTLVGTSVFATLQEVVNTRMRIFAGVAIVLAAVLASLQTFLSSAERAEKNWTAGEMWSSIRREITEMLALHPANLATPTIQGSTWTSSVRGWLRLQKNLRGCRITFWHASPGPVGGHRPGWPHGRPTVILAAR